MAVGGGEGIEGRFRDRIDAGRQLAERLSSYAGRPDVIVLGLPRGGIPVACEVARALGAPLDVFVVRKLGWPMQPELAMGAIASGGVLVLNEDVIEMVGAGPELIESVAEEERRELARREREYRGDRPPPPIRGRTVILVDDGLATGSTMRAAARAVRKQDPARLVIAVPVGAPETCESLRAEADEVVCVLQPPFFQAVGLWYDRFEQTTDAEVRRLLEDAARP